MKFLKEIGLPVIIGLLLAVLLKSFVLSPVRVDGPSMEPNLTNNERVWMFKQASVKHLSVIVFDAHGEDPEASAGTDYVKRVIGLPGDTVAFKNNKLYVNGKQINQSFISAAEGTTGTGSGTGRCRVWLNSTVGATTLKWCQRASISSWVTTEASPMIAVTGALWIRIKSLGL